MNACSLPDRRLILLHGPQVQGLHAVEQFIRRCDLDEKYVLSADQATRNVLGQEFALVVVNAHLGLNPDTIGQLSGTVMAGGALLILCPNLNDWPHTPDPEYVKLRPHGCPSAGSGSAYLKRWVKQLALLDGIEILAPDQLAAQPVIKTANIQAPAGRAATRDQQTAIDTLLKTVSGQRKRPAVLTADRGRGKSAALGLAAASLLASGQCRDIIITARRFSQLEAVFKHAQAALAGSEFKSGDRSLQHSQGRLRYVAIEKLLVDDIECDLLLVDEAASLGVARLTRLLPRYPRMAFSSTEHGYEGSGRGFTLKFRQRLEQHCRGYYPATLSEPVRWREHDPLEQWIDRLLLLQQPDQTLRATTSVEVDTLQFKQLTPAQLIEDETLLAQVFGLLVEAHYQTRPVDLRYLLDAPNGQLWAACHDDEVWGLVWLMHEGGLDSHIATEIVAGRRRPQGHLAPQVLGAHLGLEQAITLNCARIQRIVVQPALQSRGIGSWMLSKLLQAATENIDYFASSFGADTSLIEFWKQAGYHAVRLSDQASAASGLHSALVIQAVSAAAHEMQQQAGNIFAGQFICQLESSLSASTSPLLMALAPEQPPAKLLPHQIKAAYLFAFAQRPFESTLSALAQLAQSLLFDTAAQSALGLQQCQLMIARCLQHQDWAQCAKTSGLSGKQACLDSLRAAVAQLLECYVEAPQLEVLRENYSALAESV